MDASYSRGFGDRFDRYTITGITWKGHDFIDSVPDDGVWSKMKEQLKPLGSAPFRILMDIAVEIVKKKLGLA